MREVFGFEVVDYLGWAVVDIAVVQLLVEGIMITIGAHFRPGRSHVVVDLEQER